MTIPRLGRVTLLAGKNGVGKTTVLEAVRIYAHRGSGSILFRIIADREQVAEFTNGDGQDSVAFTSDSLFHGWSPAFDARISIGSQGKSLVIEPCLDDEYLSPDGEIIGISVRFGETENVLWERIRSASTVVSQALSERFKRLQAQGESSLAGINCICIGPETLAAAQLSSWWNDIVLTAKEDRLSEAVSLVTGTDVVRVGMLGGSDSKWGQRRAFVRLRDQDYPVPLKSFGDGQYAYSALPWHWPTAAAGFY